MAFVNQQHPHLQAWRFQFAILMSNFIISWFFEHHRDRIRLFFFPDSSPELNPDELLNNDVKANAVGRQRAKNKAQMIDHIRSYLCSIQPQPNIVQRYFHEKHVAYAAA